MIKPEAGPNVVAMGVPTAPDDPLPYRIELWSRSSLTPGRLIGRAASMILARAIFTAATVEFAGERITLSRGIEILQDTG